MDCLNLSKHPSLFINVAEDTQTMRSLMKGLYDVNNEHMLKMSKYQNRYLLSTKSLGFDMYQEFMSYIMNDDNGCFTMPEYSLKMPFYFFPLKVAIAFQKRRLHRKGRVLNLCLLGLYWDTGMPHSFSEKLLEPVFAQFWQIPCKYILVS